MFYQDAKTAQEAKILKQKTAQQLARQMALALEALKLPEEEIQKKIKEDPIVAPFIDQKRISMGGCPLWLARRSKKGAAVEKRYTPNKDF